INVLGVLAYDQFSTGCPSPPTADPAGTAPAVARSDAGRGSRIDRAPGEQPHHAQRNRGTLRLHARTGKPSIRIQERIGAGVDPQAAGGLHEINRASTRRNKGTEGVEARVRELSSRGGQRGTACDVRPDRRGTGSNPGNQARSRQGRPKLSPRDRESSRGRDSLRRDSRGNRSTSAIGIDSCDVARTSDPTTAKSCGVQARRRHQGHEPKSRTHDESRGRRILMLHDIRVLEISAPETMMAGRILADFGAEVVVVEPPGGAPGRRMVPFLADVPGVERSLTWHALNRNKRAITLDLNAADGRELI